MLAIHERLAELFTLSRQRRLTASEEAEQQQCLHVNASYCWEMSRLHNESLLADLTGDTEWQQELSEQMLELRDMGRLPKRRK